MKVPNHLKHQPFARVENYHEMDGYYDKNNTDAKGLSIGRAQWNSEEVSVKVWRHTGEKWSRQSEELPLHRVLDLAILILTAIKDPSHLNNSHMRNGTKVTVDYNKIHVQNGLYKIEVEVDQPYAIKDFLNKYFESVLLPRIRCISDLSSMF